MNKIKILIADDHQLLIDGIKSLVNSVEGFEVIGEAGDGIKVLEIVKLKKTDIVLMDINMPVMDGIETTKRLRKEHPSIHVLALTMHNEKGMINKMLDAGANGYVLKNTNKEELVEAIRKVASGSQYFSSAITITLLEKNSDGSNSKKHSEEKVELTAREKEIIALIAQGFSSREIGEKLFISPRTADKHRTNLIEKLQVKNIADLVYYAMKNGLIG
ncbi:MAG: response regulator transcription factor [Bacteroidia bacterium]|nr:response regulator transcription factor [Bacteroidia bacterium]